MNPDTGAIAEFETEDDARQAGYTVPLTREQAVQFKGLNRHQRLALTASLRGKPQPRKPLTDDERRAAKNQRKRQRKARKAGR